MEHLVAYGGNNTQGPIEVATACNAHGGTGRLDFESETFLVLQRERWFCGRCGRTYDKPSFQDAFHEDGSPAGVYYCQGCRGAKAVPFVTTDYSTGQYAESLISSPVTTGTDKARSAAVIVSQDRRVRRLMPIECERLQGFPDHWTRYAADGSEISDSQRYRMLGNAVAVPVAEWIAKRIMRIERDRYC